MNNSINSIPAAADNGAPVPVARQRREYDRADRITALCALLLGYAAFRCFIGYFTGVYMTLTVAAAVVIAFVYGRVKGKTITAEYIALSVITLLVSVSFSLYPASVVVVLGAFFTLALYLYSLSALFASGKALSERTVFYAFMRDFVSVPFSMFGSIFASIFQKRKNSEKKRRIIVYILAGLLIAAIPTAIAVTLLRDADAAFDALLGNLFAGIDESFFVEILYFFLSLPFSMYFFGALSGNAYGVRDKVSATQKQAESAEKTRFLPSAVTVFAIIPLIAVYLLFFFSQLSYFISGFLGVLPGDYSYAEYARSGFFELCRVAFLNLACVAAAEIFTKRNGGKRSVACRILVCAVSVLSLGFIAIGLSKMLMYISNYGLTHKRVLTSWFMLLLAAVFFIIILYEILPRVRVALSVVLCASVLFVPLLFCNMDARIAQYNVEKYMSGELESVDVHQLYELGDSAVEYMIPLIDDSDPEVSFTVRKMLAQRKQLLEKRKDSSFLQKNSTSEKALSLLEEIDLSY